MFLDEHHDKKFTIDEFSLIPSLSKRTSFDRWSLSADRCVTWRCWWASSIAASIVANNFCWYLSVTLVVAYALAVKLGLFCGDDVGPDNESWSLLVGGGCLLSSCCLAPPRFGSSLTSRCVSTIGALRWPVAANVERRTDYQVTSPEVVGVDVGRMGDIYTERK